MVNSWTPLTTFRKDIVLDIWLGSEYAIAHWYPAEKIYLLAKNDN